MNLFGGKKKATETKPSAPGGGGISFSRVQVVSKPEIVGKLLRGIKEQTIESDVSRQKLKAASMVSGQDRRPGPG